jgi:D-beta-D-heptose 7-phosphate kinase/D-beta-D-heptose 1-phosphate adenosyltransferase
MSSVLPNWQSRRVLVLGDTMLDRFVYGHVDRISPEAPVPVLRQSRIDAMLGGAGNVARNIASLGGTAILVATIGVDDAGRTIEELLSSADRIEPQLVKSTTPTIQKTRFIADKSQLLRVDIEEPSTLSADTRRQILAQVRQNLDEVDAVVLSDYGKGLLSADLVAEVIELAKAASIPVIVDPKFRDLTRYSGADVITPNIREAEQATGITCDSDQGAAAAARQIQRIGGFGAVALTRGAAGMTICSDRADAPCHLPATAIEIFDVSGAGDTVIATLALALAEGLPVHEGAMLANVAAGIAVSKVGTAEVLADDLEHALFLKTVSGLEDKIYSEDRAVARARRWNAQGLKVGFTNGCFDLIHPGHVTLLRKARSYCDRLIVAINSDESVRRLKGPSRPVQTEAARALVMSAIASVDMVVIFEEDTPLRLIEALEPSVLIKGADYTVSTVVGGDHVAAKGGKVVLIDLEAGHSTTNLLAGQQRKTRSGAH